jgi:hypothetical protein
MYMVANKMSAINMRKPRCIDVLKDGTVSKGAQLKIRRHFLSGKRPNTKDLISQAKKEGVDVGKRPNTQEKRTYAYFADMYNETVDCIAEVDRKQQNETRKERQQEARMKIQIEDALEKLDKFQQPSLVLKNNKMAKMLFSKLYNKKTILTAGDSHVTLNNDNLADFEEMVDKDEFFVHSDESNYKNTVNKIIDGGGKIMLSNVTSAAARCFLKGGAYFKWKHKLDGIDLTNQQINHVDTLETNDEPCFLHALSRAGVPDNILDAAKLMIKHKEIALCKIKQLVQNFPELYITVRPLNDKNLTHIGDRTKPEIKLGLIENHYFYIEPVDITSYAVKNYHSIKHTTTWKHLYCKRQRDSKRCIDSYQLIKLLMEHKDTLLREITRDELMYTYRTKSSSVIRDITPHDICFRDNKVKTCKERDSYVNVFFDFESTTDGDKHIPYLVRASCFPDQDFRGIDCGRDLMEALAAKYPDTRLRLIAHNAAYDYRLLFKSLSRVTNAIERGKMLLAAQAHFYYAGKLIQVNIQDSYALIPEPLRNFGKMFQLNQAKEIMPYSLYTESNIKRQYIPMSECVEACKIEFSRQNIGCTHVDHAEYVATFMQNCKEWDVMRDGHVDIVEYSSRYCKIDCDVLEKGYNAFAEQIMSMSKSYFTQHNIEHTPLDLDDFVSISQLSDTFLQRAGVYDGVKKVGLNVREFIQSAMVGGRVMTRNNKKQYVTGSIQDFDAVSLYPSSMVRLGGYLKGEAKLLTSLEYNAFKDYDGYFVEIAIHRVKKPYAFPLASFKTDTGTRHWSNNLIGKHLVVDKTTLEDLIEFQNIEFTVIRGYYYDEGRNNALKTVMTYLFEQRLAAKQQKNPIQATYKLIMNSAYGKTLIKAHETDGKHVKARDLERHVLKHYNHIKDYYLLNNNQWRVNHYKTVDNHFNNAHCGVEVLSTSKRIMNEVMCLAEDEGLDIYYQDTDSMHLATADVDLLASRFKLKYGRDLIGKGLGQFHCDFDSNIIAKGIHATECVFLGKKVYCDKLEGLDKDGNAVVDFHSRLKSVSNDAIRYETAKRNCTQLELYKNLYDDERSHVDFDLTAGGQKLVFQYEKNMDITNRDKFTRRIRAERFAV